MLRPLKYYLRRKQLERLGIGQSATAATDVYGATDIGWGVATDYLRPGDIVYSFGVGDSVLFDLGVIEKNKAIVHAFDPTPRCLDWIGQQDLPEDFHFHPYGLADHDGEISFLPPRKAKSFHYTPVQRYRFQDQSTAVTGEVKCLRTIMQELGHTHIHLLKMDIEGGEYDVLDDILDAGILADQLLVEFHHAFATIPFAQTLRIGRRLVEAGYHPFYMSDRTYEVSYLHQRVLRKAA